jgi:hypothetical protein
MASRHEGTRRLADEFFLVAHDDVTGKPRVHPLVIGCGLAGALLGEQILLGRADIRSGFLVVSDPHPLADPLAQAVLGRLMGYPEPQRVPFWLSLLADAAEDEVARRLAADGIVTRGRSGVLGRKERWLPVDMSTAAWPAARLRMLLSRSEPLAAADVVLAGLAVACGLGSRLLWDTSPETRQYMDYLRFTLAEPLRQLISHTETAVGNAVLSRRV